MRQQKDTREELNECNKNRHVQTIYLFFLKYHEVINHQATGIKNNALRHMGVVNGYKLKCKCYRGASSEKSVCRILQIRHLTLDGLDSDK